jgi:hypothetical protein
VITSPTDASFAVVFKHLHSGTSMPSGGVHPIALGRFSPLASCPEADAPLRVVRRFGLSPAAHSEKRTFARRARLNR